MAAVSTIPSEYLEDVSDERSLGAVSSLSSEDDVTTVEHNSLDWYAVVQRTAKQRLQDLHKHKASAPAAQNAALRREAATPTIVTVVRPSKESGAAKSEWKTETSTTLDVALGPGRLGASWRRTFPVAFGVGVGGGTGPDGKLDAASSSGCEALVAPLVAALCPGLSGALDGSLPRGAATTVLAVGSAAACEECRFEETEATGGAQLASLAAALRHAFGLDADDAPPREDAFARLLHGTSVAPDAAPVVATCVGLGPRELDAALPCLEWGALSSRDDAARRSAEADARRAEAEARFAAEAAELESSAAARSLEARFEALELQLEGAANVAIEAASQAAAATDARDAEAAAALAALNLAALQQRQLVVVPEPPASPTRSVSTAAQYSPPGPPALLEQELERSRAEAARQAVELRRREELAGRDRDRAEQAVLREKAAAEARVEELRRAASRELEDSLRDVHGAVAKQADAARAALRDLADERDAAVEDKAKLVAAAKAERDALERELRDARADAAGVAAARRGGRRLRRAAPASAEAERRRAEATAAAAAVDVAPRARRRRQRRPRSPRRPAAAGDGSATRESRAARRERILAERKAKRRGTFNAAHYPGTLRSSASITSSR
ncbi:hypothetical protein JL721_4432 [Aureococcus anophagefferens]|nr:hypothetical protein JL721_4432 [Aureococcus anophagefferens]